MNRTELAAALAVELGIRTDEAERFTIALFDEMSNALSRGESLKLAHFGAFEIRRRKEHRAVNISSGMSYVMPERNDVVFRPGAELKEKVNRGVTEA
ncbi:MAG: HU family DNA-binding protein [Oscillospiraceae bacterium]|nr:HU family DNA-binding protein [Oscillospiraceae bacterium]